MPYRLIRFSTDDEVVMDAKLETPNGAGSNVVWVKEPTSKTAFLWDYKEKCWYMLDKNPTELGITWVTYDSELPTYIRMLLLTGGL